ncbi:MAG TPA: TadE/TadG family type IV pilus assembly protein [Bradyrhizobium sp.]|jgi:Flp pilus assembly protein TadG|nr:TadE/TadG family type IV pilus assembly protein [Bradyrhizobium sp.]
MKATSTSRLWFRARRSLAGLWRDPSAIAATEFAVIVPIMLVMFFGTVEFSSGLAVDRKVTLVARTLSDLTSQSAAPIDDTYLKNVFTASIATLAPYSATPTRAQLSEVYVDSNQVAKIQWSKAATIASGATQATLGASSRNAGDTVTLPSQLLTKQTYLIFSEVSYLYTPTVGYVMGSSGVTLTDTAYTRPRQVLCVIYNGLPANNPGPCPTP